ncbi:MAG TPA: CoA transferase [Candidatus Binataceae bacterium]|jgi:crotonobetainyl-CoA:carnitine CoA-transferase CaiB-like acyl-CoA transferase|nr:CoA transferase [Candidatus Binataceae bacterium]
MSRVPEGIAKLRVLELSMGWAGPLVGELLGEMGMQVVKVEDTRNFDWWRGSAAMGLPEMRPIERAPTFNSVNRGKLGVTLDLSRPRGVEILRRLAALSDVLIENFSPGVMERLGIDWPQLGALNPRLVMVSMPAFGAEGPDAGSRGYGMSIEAMAGVTGQMAYHDGGPPYMMSNALGDPTSGLHGALAALAALRERARTGRGQHVEVAEVETVVPFMAGALLDYQFTGEVPRAIGNRSSDAVPHGIFRCAGEHAFVALGAHTEEHWQGLLRALGLERLGRDPRFAGAAHRKANEDALDAELGAALGALGVDEAVERLLAAGVPAGQVSPAPAVLADRQLVAREFFVPIQRAVVGTCLYPGAPVRMSATPLDASRPSPLLGEHNEAVLRELLGMSTEEIAQLERDGLIGSLPRA